MNKKITKILALLSTIAILANCGGADDSDDNERDTEYYSDFADVTSDGDISLSSLKEKEAGTYECVSGIGCGAYAVGFTPDGENIRAISGFLPADDFTSQPRASTHNIYYTSYRYSKVVSSYGNRSEYGHYEDTVDLFFDPKTGILKGDNEVMDFKTKVDGYDFKGSFSGVGIEKGVVEGKINSSGLVGAFHGNNEWKSVAGFMMGAADQ